MGQETYVHFVAQETRIIRKLFIFNFFIVMHQKRSKSTIVQLAFATVFLLELVVINESLYNQAYIFLIIEL